MTCECGSIGADPSVVRLAPCHHRYYRGDKELTSVGKVLRSVWPIQPDFSKADPEVLESARERGVEVDSLVSRYINGTLQAIPAFTRSDSVELFEKFYKWWDRQGFKARAQVILADEEVAGTCDIRGEDFIWDLKTVYNIEPSYPIQLGMYGILADSFKSLAIIHCTKRFAEPRLIELDPQEVMDDAATVRRMWSMVNRRTNDVLRRNAD